MILILSLICAALQGTGQLIISVLLSRSYFHDQHLEWVFVCLIKLDFKSLGVLRKGCYTFNLHPIYLIMLL